MKIAVVEPVAMPLAGLEDAKLRSEDISVNECIKNDLDILGKFFWQN